MEQRKKTGLVHLYCGDGKGKTTAAMGLITRALGHGFKVLLVQFLKSGQSGELVSLRRLPGFAVMAGQVTGKFSISMTDEEKAATRALHLAFFRKAVRQVTDGPVDLLVLDEIIGAIESQLMDENELIAFLDDRPAHLEVVMTGRRASPAVLERADYISEIACVRHPFQRGIRARRGIEY